MHHLCPLCAFQPFTGWVFLAVFPSVFLSSIISFDRAVCLTGMESERPHVRPVSASVTTQNSPPLLFDDSVSFFCFVCLCMRTGSQVLIESSLMMLVVSTLPHVTCGHADWITPDLRQADTWLHISKTLKPSGKNAVVLYAQPTCGRKKKVRKRVKKEKRQNCPEFGKQICFAWKQTRAEGRLAFC